MRSLNRAGFTLIELMVALALSMFLMVIMTECFVLAVDTFTGLKAIGDMQQNLRTACTILQSDLAEDHFEGKRRLSDPTIFNAATPIQAGYFAIKQGSLVVPMSSPLQPYTYEGSDAFVIPSYYSVNHVLGMTVKRKGNRPGNFFSVAMNDPTGGALLQRFFLPGNFPPTPNLMKGTAYGIAPIPMNNAGSYINPTPDLPNVTYTMPYTGGTLGFYSSQWADVYYYLVRMGSTEEPNNPLSLIGTPTFGLYRAQFVMVPDSTNVNNTNPKLAVTPASMVAFQGLAWNPNAGNLQFISPTDAAFNATLAGRTINLSTAAYFPISPATVAAADPRLIPKALVAGSAASGNSELNGVQSQGSTELVCPNVVSFNVQMVPAPWSATVNYSPGNLVFYGGFNYSCTVANIGQLPANLIGWNVLPAPYSTGFVDIPGAAGGYYDTSGMNLPGYTNNFGLGGVRVTLRVWDNKTRQTRQASVVQDL